MDHLDLAEPSGRIRDKKFCVLETCLLGENRDQSEQDMGGSLSKKIVLSLFFAFNAASWASMTERFLPVSPGSEKILIRLVLAGTNFGGGGKGKKCGAAPGAHPLL